MANAIKKTRIINVNEAVRLIGEAVRLKGRTYVYPRVVDGLNCVNWINGEPSCIVGHVLDALGLTESICDNLSAEVSADRANWSTETDVYFTDLAVIALAQAQVVQDFGGTWGLAHNAAIRVGNMGLRLRLKYPEIDRYTAQ